MKLPRYVKNCIEKLNAAGYSAYAVGGAVRDSLLGVEPSDWDVTTSALPEEIMLVFQEEHTIPTGIKHGTITVVFDGDDGTRIPVEITTYRIDGEYRDSRHPESVNFSKDVSDDLSRRDFTINAMAYNETDGIIDVFGGIVDLENRIVRAVGEPEKRFSEDALRILRAFRFSAQLGFEIEEKTLDGAKKCSHLLKNIARERIGVEFRKLLSSCGVVYSLEKIIENNIWNELFDVSVPDKSIITRLSDISNGSFETRLAVLLSDFDKAAVCELLDSLRLSNDEKKLVIRLCSVKSFEVSGENLEREARLFLHCYSDILSLASEVLKFYFRNADEFLKIVEIESQKKRPLSISDLEVKGSDILPMCQSDYKLVGLTLKMLLSHVIENPELNKKEKLIEIAKKSLQ